MENSATDDGQWAFQQKREPHDKAWARVFWASLAAAAVAGVAAWASMNAKFNAIVAHPGELGDASHCTLPAALNSGPRGRSLLASDDPQFHVLAFAKDVLWLLLITLGASVGLAVAYLQLFRRAPKVAVYGAIVTMIACLAAAGIAGGVVTMAIFGVFIALIVWWMFRARDRLDLVARLLSIATEGLAANPMVGPLCLGLNGAFFLAAVPFAAASYAAVGNGHIVANGDVRHHSGGVCYGNDDPDGGRVQVPCCGWQVSVGGWTLLAVVVLAMMWTRAVFAQIRTYTIAGSITQWYFYGHTSGTTMLSLRHATTSGFGSVCFAALIITLCDILRSIAQQVRNNRYGQLVAMVVAVCFSWILQWIQEFIRAVTNFATVQMAATGEPFFASSRSVLGLLVRNGMKSFTVWWLPNFVLNLAAYAIAALWWVGVSFAADAVWSAQKAPRASGDAILAGFFSALCAAVVLVYTGGILKNIVDTLYICYARDLDRGAVTKPEVHDAYAALPKPEGAVVVQPNDDIVYGAMEEGAANAPPRADSRAAPLLDEA